MKPAPTEISSVCAICRDLKASAIYVVTYHNLLEHFGRPGDSRTSDPGAIVLAGGLAGQQTTWANL